MLNTKQPAGKSKHSAYNVTCTWPQLTLHHWCSNKFISSLHCFWHIWQYQRSFWRPLALIRFPIALGLRKSAFPILISQKNQDLMRNNNSCSVSTLPTLSCVVTRMPRFASTRVPSLIRVYLYYREMWRERLSVLYLRLRRPAALTFIEVNMFARTSAAVFLPQW